MPVVGPNSVPGMGVWIVGPALGCPGRHGPGAVSGHRALKSRRVGRPVGRPALSASGVVATIRAPEAIFESRPDYVLILPWNLTREITEQMAGIRSWGGKFVVAIPEVTVL